METNSNSESATSASGHGSPKFPSSKEPSTHPTEPGKIKVYHTISKFLMFILCG